VYEQQADGVPSVLLQHAVFTANEQLAAEAASVLQRNRAGYTTAPGSRPGDAAGDGDQPHSDEMELQLETAPTTDMVRLAARAAATIPDATTLLEHGGILAASTASGQPYSDYDPRWPLLVHPTAFPFGKGQCPTDMSMETWTRLLLNRYPHSQFQENISFQVSAVLKDIHCHLPTPTPLSSNPAILSCCICQSNLRHNCIS